MDSNDMKAALIKAVEDDIEAIVFRLLEPCMLPPEATRAKNLVERLKPYLRQHQSQQPAAPASGVDEEVAIDVMMRAAYESHREDGVNFFPWEGLVPSEKDKREWRAAYRALCILSGTIPQPDLAALLAKPETVEAVSLSVKAVPALNGAFVDHEGMAQATISALRQLAGIPQPTTESQKP